MCASSIQAFQTIMKLEREKIKKGRILNCRYLQKTPTLDRQLNATRLLTVKLESPLHTQLQVSLIIRHKIPKTDASVES